MRQIVECNPSGNSKVIFIDGSIATYVTDKGEIVTTEIFKERSNIIATLLPKELEKNTIVLKNKIGDTIASFIGEDGVRYIFVRYNFPSVATSFRGSKLAYVCLSDDDFISVLNKTNTSLYYTHNTIYFLKDGVLYLLVESDDTEKKELKDLITENGVLHLQNVFDKFELTMDLRCYDNNCVETLKKFRPLFKIKDFARKIITIGVSIYDILANDLLFEYDCMIANKKDSVEVVGEYMGDNVSGYNFQVELSNNFKVDIDNKVIHMFIDNGANQKIISDFLKRNPDWTIYAFNVDDMQFYVFPATRDFSNLDLKWFLQPNTPIVKDVGGVLKCGDEELKYNKYIGIDVNVIDIELLLEVIEKFKNYQFCIDDVIVSDLQNERIFFLDTALFELLKERLDKDLWKSIKMCEQIGVSSNDTPNNNFSNDNIEYVSTSHFKDSSNSNSDDIDREKCTKTLSFGIASYAYDAIDSYLVNSKYCRIIVKVNHDYYVDIHKYKFNIDIDTRKKVAVFSGDFAEAKDILYKLIMYGYKIVLEDGVRAKISISNNANTTDMLVLYHLYETGQMHFVSCVCDLYKINWWNLEVQFSKDFVYSVLNQCFGHSFDVKRMMRYVTKYGCFEYEIPNKYYDWFVEHYNKIRPQYAELLQHSIALANRVNQVFSYIQNLNGLGYYIYNIVYIDQNARISAEVYDVLLDCQLLYETPYRALLSSTFSFNKVTYYFDSLGFRLVPKKREKGYRYYIEIKSVGTKSGNLYEIAEDEIGQDVPVSLIVWKEAGTILVDVEKIGEYNVVVNLTPTFEEIKLVDDDKVEIYFHAVSHPSKDEVSDCYGAEVKSANYVTINSIGVLEKIEECDCEAIKSVSFKNEYVSDENSYNIPTPENSDIAIFDIQKIKQDGDWVEVHISPKVKLKNEDKERIVDYLFVDDMFVKKGGF